MIEGDRGIKLNDKVVSGSPIVGDKGTVITMGERSYVQSGSFLPGDKGVLVTIFGKRYALPAEGLPVGDIPIGITHSMEGFYNSYEAWSPGPGGYLKFTGHYYIDVWGDAFHQERPFKGGETVEIGSDICDVGAISSYSGGVFGYSSSGDPVPSSPPGTPAYIYNGYFRVLLTSTDTGLRAGSYFKIDTEMFKADSVTFLYYKNWSPIGYYYEIHIADGKRALLGTEKAHHSYDETVYLYRS